MPTIAFSPEHADFQPQFYLNGELILLQNSFISGNIVFALNQLPYAVFIFSNPSSELSQNVRNAAAKNFEFKVMQGGQLIFKGVVKSCNFKIKSNEKIIELHCGDLMETMMKLPAVASGQKDRISYFIERQTESFSTKFTSDFKPYVFLKENFLFRNGISRWEYIERLVDFSGGSALLQNGELLILNLLKENPETCYSFQQEDDISLDLNFNPNADYKKVRIEYWDSENQEINWVEAGNEENEHIIRLDRTEYDEETIDLWAQSILKKSKLKAQNGTLKTLGNTIINPGTSICFNGLDFLDHDEYFLVTQTGHVLTANSWQTIYRIGFEENENLPETQSNTFITGKVIDFNDPEGSCRIKVSLPAFQNREIWASLLSMNAGNNFGTCFRPNLGDEVLVALAGTFSESAFILGAAYSNYNQMPLKINVQGIVTKKGSRIVMNEEEERIEISTANGTSLIISEEHGIQMKAASGNSLMTINESVGIQLQTNGSKVLMNDQLTISSNSNLEIDTAGSLDLKGSIININ